MKTSSFILLVFFLLIIFQSYSQKASICGKYVGTSKGEGCRVNAELLIKPDSTYALHMALTTKIEIGKNTQNLNDNGKWEFKSSKIKFTSVNKNKSVIADVKERKTTNFIPVKQEKSSNYRIRFSVFAENIEECWYDDSFVECQDCPLK